MPISEAFDKMVEVALKNGARSIKDLEGAYYQKLDDDWSFAINGHDVEMKAGEDMVNIPPFEAAVWRKGWLAAILSPFAGVFMNASEDAFIAALDVALDKKLEREGQ